MKYFLLSATSILIFYGVNFVHLPLDAHRVSYIFFVFAYVFMVLKLQFRLKELCFPDWFFLFIFFWLSLIYSLFVVLYSGTSEFMFVRMHLDYFLTAFVAIPVLFLLLARIRMSSFSIFDVPTFIIYLGAIQAAFMFAMLLFPSFQKAMFTIIETGGAIERYESQYRFRAVGLTGFASYSMGVCQSFIAYLFPILWLNNIGKLKFFITLILFALVAGSAVLAARTSYMFIGVLILWLLLTILVSSDATYRKKMLAVLVFSSCVGGALGFYLLYLAPDQFKVMTGWMFELFLSTFNDGTVSVASVEAMKSLMFLPDEKTILWGDGLYFVEGAYYQKTDIGFLRVLLYGGIFGSLLFYSSFVYLFYLGVKYTSVFFGNRLALLLFLYVCQFFVVNIKGSIFFDGFNTMKFLMLYVFALGFYLRKYPVPASRGYTAVA